MLFFHLILGFTSGYFLSVSPPTFCMHFWYVSSKLPIRPILTYWMPLHYKYKESCSRLCKPNIPYFPLISFLVGQNVLLNTLFSLICNFIFFPLPFTATQNTQNVRFVYRHTKTYFELSNSIF